MTAPKLTAASMLTDSERPDWLEVVAVFEVTPAQRAAFASLLHVEDGVRVTVEAADASASASPRPAEEIAREMVRVVESKSGGWSVAVRNSFLASHAWKATAAEDSGIIEAEFVRLIEQGRAEGAAAALAGQRPRDLAARIRGLIQEYAGRWADGVRLPESRHLRVEACMHAMRWLWHTLRRLEADGAFPEDRITELRRYKGDDVVAKTMRGLADELEVIVRECEEKR